MTKPFEHADHDTKVFYSKVLYNVLLNLNAVEMGYYNVLLCETDDPMAGVKWKEALPHVVQRMRNGPPQEY